MIDGEPTDNQLAAGSKGSLRLSLRTEGVTAHSAYPEQGRSAIDPLLDVLADVRRTSWPSDPFFGDTTLNIGVIAGGSRPNVVAGDARADLQIRLVTDAAPVKQLLERAVGGRARLEYLSAVNPGRLDGRGSPVVPVVPVLLAPVALSLTVSLQVCGPFMSRPRPT